MTNNEKKQLARSLFMKTDLKRKQIAKQVNWTEKTLRFWIEKEGWEQLKESETITKSHLRKESYKQLGAINKVINEQFGGVPDKTLSDAKGVIRKEIEALGDMPLHNYIELSMEFTAWIQSKYPEKIMMIIEFLDEFIQEKVSELQ